MVDRADDDEWKMQDNSQLFVETFWEADGEVCSEVVKRSDVGVVRRSIACGLWKIRKVGRGEGKGCSNLFIFL